MKNIYKKKSKKITSDTICKAVEQLYPNLTGKTKLKKATEQLKKLLSEKNIFISNLESRILIENSVYNIRNTTTSKIQDTDIS